MNLNDVINSCGEIPQSIGTGEKKSVLGPIIVVISIAVVGYLIYKEYQMPMVIESLQGDTNEK